jgi:hypothetical protein
MSFIAFAMRFIVFGFNPYKKLNEWRQSCKRFSPDGKNDDASNSTDQS